MIGTGAEIYADAALPAAVSEIGKLNLVGNVVPRPWYARIRRNGRPDLLAILILADIVFWHRPVLTRGTNGRVTVRKRFAGTHFQVNARQYAAMFGVSKRQVSEAIRRLADAKLIHTIVRDRVQVGSRVFGNVLYATPDPAMIALVSEVVAVTVTAMAPPQKTVAETEAEVGKDYLEETFDRVTGGKRAERIINGVRAGSENAKAVALAFSRATGLQPDARMAASWVRQSERLAAVISQDPVHRGAALVEQAVLMLRGRYTINGPMSLLKTVTGLVVAAGNGAGNGTGQDDAITILDGAIDGAIDGDRAIDGAIDGAVDLGSWQG